MPKDLRDKLITLSYHQTKYFEKHPEANQPENVELANAGVIAQGIKLAPQVLKHAEKALKIAKDFVLFNKIAGKQVEVESEVKKNVGGSGQQEPDNGDDDGEGEGDTSKSLEKKYPGIEENTAKLLDQVNKYKKQLLERAGAAKDATSLRAAQRELNGEQIEKAIERGLKYDHIEKVQKAQQGLENLIKAVKNRMSHPGTPTAELKLLKKELSDATKLLNRSREFVPTK